MALLLRASGEQEIVSPSSGEEFLLIELQELIGGYFEAHRLSDGTFMLADEDGRSKQKPINHEASLLFGSVVVGDVLIGTQKEFGG